MATLLLGLWTIFYIAPLEQSMGIVQKIFYVHVPAAMAMYAGFGITSLTSLLYLLKPSPRFDNLAQSGVEIGVLFGLYVLISGPLWAYKAWGVAWTWDPQLTATLILFLLYSGYLLLRLFSPVNPRIRRIAAVIAVISAVDIPVIHYSVQKWGGLHPVVERSGGGGLADDMKLALLVSMAALLLLGALMMWLRYRVFTLQEEVEELYLTLDDIQRGRS